MSVLPGRLDERVADELLAETRGNPLALLELPRGLTAAQLAGGFGLPGALSLSGRIEESFVNRLEALPAETQRLLLAAAAEPLGDAALLWRAAERLGIAGAMLEPAQAAGLIEIDGRVRFRHPLVRSAIYRAAAPTERRLVHRALGEATDARVDPDRRAWHLAEAVAGRDEDVAAELERAAGRAQARGGLAAAAAFHERSALLTVDPDRRGQRLLAAASAKHDSGALDAALRCWPRSKPRRWTSSGAHTPSFCEAESRWSSSTATTPGACWPARRDDSSRLTPSWRARRTSRRSEARWSETSKSRAARGRSPTAARAARSGPRPAPGG